MAPIEIYRNRQRARKRVKFRLADFLVDNEIASKNT